VHGVVCVYCPTETHLSLHANLHSNKGHSYVARLFLDLTSEESVESKNDRACVLAQIQLAVI